MEKNKNENVKKTNYFKNLGIGILAFLGSIIPFKDANASQTLSLPESADKIMEVPVSNKQVAKSDKLNIQMDTKNKTATVYVNETKTEKTNQKINDLKSNASNVQNIANDLTNLSKGSNPVNFVNRSTNIWSNGQQLINKVFGGHSEEYKAKKALEKAKKAEAKALKNAEKKNKITITSTKKTVNSNIKSETNQKANIKNINLSNKKANVNTKVNLSSINTKNDKANSELPYFIANDGKYLESIQANPIDKEDVLSSQIVSLRVEASAAKYKGDIQKAEELTKLANEKEAERIKLTEQRLEKGIKSATVKNSREYTSREVSQSRINKTLEFTKLPSTLTPGEKISVLSNGLVNLRMLIQDCQKNGDSKTASELIKVYNKSLKQRYDLAEEAQKHPGDPAYNIPVKKYQKELQNQKLNNVSVGQMGTLEHMSKEEDKDKKITFNSFSKTDNLQSLLSKASNIRKTSSNISLENSKPTINAKTLTLSKKSEKSDKTTYTAPKDSKSVTINSMFNSDSMKSLLGKASAIKNSSSVNKELQNNTPKINVTPTSNDKVSTESDVKNGKISIENMMNKDNINVMLAKVSGRVTPGQTPKNPQEEVLQISQKILENTRLARFATPEKKAELESENAKLLQQKTKLLNELSTKQNEKEDLER